MGAKQAEAWGGWEEIVWGIGARGVEGPVAGQEVFSVVVCVCVIVGEFFQPCSFSGLSSRDGARGLCADHGQKVGQGPGRWLLVGQAGLPVGTAQVVV